MADFEVWIRTHLQRLRAAFQLKELTTTFLCDAAEMIVTGSADPYYSQRFVLGLDAKLVSTTGAEYVLILEDDMLFVPEARDVLAAALRAELPHAWFTLPNSNSAAMSEPLIGPFRSLRITNNFYYSGAVLARRDLLRQFVFEYLLDGLDHEIPNFDVQFSSFLARTNNSALIVAPGFFGSDPTIPSSISVENGNAHSLRVAASDTLDPHFLLHKSVQRAPSPKDECCAALQM